MHRPRRTPRRRSTHAARELDRAQHVRADLLDGLERADRPAELLALLRVLHCELERAGRGAHPVEHRRHGEPVDGIGDGHLACTRAARATATADRDCLRAATPARPRKTTVACLRVPSTVGVASTTTPSASRRTANTPRPSSVIAVTSSRSAATASGTCAFVPLIAQPSPTARADVVGERHSERESGS